MYCVGRHSLKKESSMILLVLQWLHFLILTRCSVVFDEGGQKTKENPYCAAYGGCIPGQHVMCMYEKGMSPRCTDGKDLQMNDKEKKHLLDILNEIRRRLAHGQEREMPKAYGMQQLFWDTMLATYAQAWANQCDADQLDGCRNTEQDRRVGQTLVARRFNYPDWSMPGHKANYTYNTQTTEMKYQFFSVNITDNITKRDGVMIRVRTPYEARIAITIKASEDNNIYEVILGSSNNTKSIIRRNKVDSPLLADVATPELLSDVEFRAFWVRWHDESVSAGQEGNSTPILIAKLREAHPVTHVGVASGSGATGTWKIEVPIKPENKSMPGYIKSHIIEEFLKAIYTRDVTASQIEKYPGDDFRNPFLIAVYGKNSRVGCGMSSYLTYYRDYDENPVIYNQVEIVCNFAIEPQVGESVYTTTWGDGEDLTPCGCSKGFYEDKCLCIKGEHPEVTCGSKACVPRVVALPVVIVENIHKLGAIERQISAQIKAEDRRSPKTPRTMTSPDHDYTDHRLLVEILSTTTTTRFPVRGRPTRFVYTVKTTTENSIERRKQELSQAPARMRSHPKKEMKLLVRGLPGMVISADFNDDILKLKHSSQLTTSRLTEDEPQKGNTY